MKIALAQLNYHIGNFEFNTGKIISSIQRAEKEGADLVIFAELAICGYPPLDFLDYHHFNNKCLDSINSILPYCKNTAVIIGGPSVNKDPAGKNIFNSAYVIENGAISAIVPKTLLPTYDVFDEYRWFESGNNQGCVTVKGVRIALTVCEDLWNMDEDPLYDSWPMNRLIGEGPHLMINIAASPFNFNHAGERKKILEKNIRQFKLPLIYVNQVGAHADIIFDGGSLIYNGEAVPQHEMKFFEEDFFMCEFNTASLGFNESGYTFKGLQYFQKEDQVYRALVSGIRDYFNKMGFKNAILGLSGGIDSAIVLALAAEALGKDNVHSLLMPSEFSSTHSVSDSEKMCRKLGTSYEIIPVKEIYNSTLSALDNNFKGLPFDVTEENLQARIRGILLMAVSNKKGYILLNTSNKSELAVGYGTLYGDMCGGLSVIGDLYKTEVYKLAEFINRNDEIIPENIIHKAPSAELRPDQKDSDSLPEYSILDGILFRYIEETKGPDVIISEGYDAQLVYKTLGMVNRNEWKRFQFAPILRVSSKAFGRGRRMPLVAKYL